MLIIQDLTNNYIYIVFVNTPNKGFINSKLIF